MPRPLLNWFHTLALLAAGKPEGAHNGTETSRAAALECLFNLVPHQTNLLESNEQVVHSLQEGQKVQTQVVWQAEQLHRDVQERKQEVGQLRLSTAAGTGQRSVGDVDNDLDTVEADKAVEERAKDELLRKQGRLRCD